MKGTAFQMRETVDPATLAPKAEQPIDGLLSPAEPLISAGVKAAASPLSMALYWGGTALIIAGCVLAFLRILGWIGTHMGGDKGIAFVKDLGGGANQRSMLTTWLIVVGLIFGGWFLRYLGSL